MLSSIPGVAKAGKVLVGEIVEETSKQTKKLALNKPFSGNNGSFDGDGEMVGQDAPTYTLIKPATETQTVIKKGVSGKGTENTEGSASSVAETSGLGGSEDSLSIPNSGTGTVWDNVVSTEGTYSGSIIPRSFELSTGDGANVWMNPNATKHIAEYAQSVANDFPPNVVNLRVQEQIRSLQSAIETATKNGVPYNEKITVNGWQLEIRAPRNEEQLPTVVHARPVGSGG